MIAKVIISIALAAASLLVMFGSDAGIRVLLCFGVLSFGSAGFSVFYCVIDSVCEKFRERRKR